MTTSIFIRTYAKDREWLSYCLRSLEVHAKGFREIIVAVPNADKSAFDGFDFRNAVRVPVNDPDCPPYVAQQVCKLEADLHCDADFIMFLDSDCVAYRDFTPEEFFSFSGTPKPIQLIRHWAGLGKDAVRWRDATKQLVGFEPTFEHMATLPLVYDRHTLRLFRDYLAETHKKILWEYVKHPHTHSMSEFNGLGAFAHRFTPQLYDWRTADPATDAYPRPLHQHWSHIKGGISKQMAERFEAFISGDQPEKKHKLLMAVHSYPGANPIVARHWQYYHNAGADQIIGIGTEGSGCEWPENIPTASIGVNRYMDGKSDHLCRRFIQTIEECFMNGMEWDHLCIIEYDAIFLKPMPRDLPAGIVAHLAGGTPAGCTCTRFYHCPWIMDRETARRVISCGKQMIAERDIELGSPDCFLGKMIDRFSLPITDCPFPVYSRNSLDIPAHLEEAKQAVKSGAVMIHGVKDAKMLAALMESV